MFFGDPATLGVKEDALACVQMAIAMQQRVGELAEEWRDSGIETSLRCRIGVNTGYCTVGNFGSEDRMDALIDGKEFAATAGDLIKLPMGIPHGLFNKSDQVLKCLFWVTPTRKLYDLFWAIHSMKDQNPPDVVALSAKHEVNFLPPPPGA